MRIRVITAFVFVLATCTQVFPAQVENANASNARAPDAYCNWMIPFKKTTTMREVAEWYTKHSARALIFEGKVISIGTPGNLRSNHNHTVDFAVTRTFRGKHHDQVSVGALEGSCGYTFQTGQTYLVYATTGLKGGGWYVSGGGATRNIAGAGPFLRVLTGENPTAEDLLTYQQHWEQYDSKIVPEPMTGVMAAGVGGVVAGGAVHQSVKRRQGARSLLGCVISTLGLGLYFAGFAVAKWKLAMRVTETLSVLAVQYGFFYSLVNIVFQSGDAPTFGYVIYTSVILIAASFLLVRRAHIRAIHVAP